MADGRVEYEIRADDSKLDEDLKKSEEKMQKSAEKTAEKQKAVEEKSVENTKKANKEKVQAVENSDNKIEEHNKKSQESITETAKKEGQKVVNANKENAAEIVDNSEKAAQKIEKSVSSAADESGKSVESMKNKSVSAAQIIGKAFAAVVTATAAVGTAAVKSSIDAESSFAKVKTLLSGGNANGYYNQLMDLSNQTGVSFENLSESMYQALSAGVSEDKAVDFVKSSVSLAKGGFTETATAIDVVTTALNAYGLAAEDAAHVQDVLITTQNKGKTTVDELAHSMGQIIPTAKSVGVSLDQLGAMYATVTANGVATSEATTYMNSMLNELASSSTTASKALSEAASGKSFKQLMSEGESVAEIIARIDSYAKQSGKSMTDMFGSVEAAKAAQILVDNSGKFVDNLDAMVNSSGAAEEAAATMMDTLGEKINVLVANGKNLLTELGNELAPIISDAIDEIMANLPEIKETIKTIAHDVIENVGDIAETITGIIKTCWELRDVILAAVVAFTAFKAAIAIGNLISAVVYSIQSFTTATKAATTAQAAFNAVGAANPFTVILGVISAAVGAITVFAATVQDGSDKIKSFSADVSALADNSKKLVNDAESLSSLIDQYKKVSDSTSDAKTKSEELAKIQDTLNETYGKSANQIDLVNGEYEEQLELLQNLNEQERIRSLNQVQNDLAEARNKLQEAGHQQVRVNLEFDDDSADELNNVFKKLQDKYNTDAITAFDFSSLKKKGNLSVAELFFNSEDINQQIEFLTEMKEAILATGEANGVMADSYNQVYDLLDTLLKLKDNVITLEEAEARLNGTNMVTKESTDNLSDSISSASTVTDSFATSTKSAAQTVSDLTAEMNELSAAFAEQNESGQLSIDTTLKLIDKGYDACLIIDRETGAVRLNAEAYRDLASAKIEAEEAAVKEAKASLDSMYNKKIESAYMTGDVVNGQKLQAEYNAKIKEYDTKLALYDKIRSGIGNVVTGTYSSSTPGGVKKDTTSSSSSGKSSSSTSGSSSSSGSSGSGGNLISITSYIPTIWDSETETNKKLRKSSGLTNISKSGQLVSINGGAESNVSTKSSKAVGGSASAYETTLADVVKAVNGLKKSQDEMKITVTSILQCDKRTLAKVTAEGINEITKATGKSPLQ